MPLVACAAVWERCTTVMAQSRRRSAIGWRVGWWTTISWRVRRQIMCNTPCVPWWRQRVEQRVITMRQQPVPVIALPQTKQHSPIVLVLVLMLMQVLVQVQVLVLVLVLVLSSQWVTAEA